MNIVQSQDLCIVSSLNKNTSQTFDTIWTQFRWGISVVAAGAAAIGKVACFFVAVWV